MQQRIQERLSEIETEYGFRVIYACESGSRAWGFASQDSDYDVRFIYTWSPAEYLGIYPPKDQIDLGVDPENLDFSGWDLRKAMPLFRKSNGALMEWLHSPIVYFEDRSLMASWRNLVPDYFLPHSTRAHYLGLSREIWLGGLERETITAKKYLYILRALLSAKYISQQKQPVPVEFSEVLIAVDLGDSIRAIIEEMIKAKASQNESDTIDRNPALDSFIEDERASLEGEVKRLNREPGDPAALDCFFQGAIGFTD